MSSAAPFDEYPRLCQTKYADTVRRNEEKMETETQTELVMEISNNCRCEEYDDETGESKYDEHGNTIPSQECFGCWDDDIQYFNDEILPSWLAANGWDTDTLITIRGSRMGWTASSGYLVTKAKHLLEKLSINGDYTLRLYRKGKDLEVVRSSHDEYGAGFSFELAPEDSEEDYPH